MIDDVTQLTAATVAAIYKLVREQKPEATSFEVEGLTFRLIHSALDNYKQNEQLPKSSPIEGEAGTPRESEQIQGTGINGGISEDTQRVLSQQRSTTKSGAKKRRGKKS